MTHLELKAVTLERLGEQTGVSGYYTAQDATNGLNWAQRFFVLISLCLEKQATFTLGGTASPWYHIRTSITDWLLPLRVTLAGAKVRPARLSELDALDATWQSRAGAPQRYTHLGLDLFAVYKQPALSTDLTFTYSRTPANMVSDADTPEIPAEYHPLLVDGSIVYNRAKEGGQEFGKVKPQLKRLIEGAGKLGSYVRQRSLDLRYDSLPVEIKKFDLSRLLAIEKTRNKPWLITSDTPQAQAQT